MRSLAINYKMNMAKQLASQRKQRENFEHALLKISFNYIYFKRYVKERKKITTYK